MGGTPALGGMVLPKLSQDQLHGLSSTASAASREVHAAKGHPIQSPDCSPPNVKTPESSPPWLVRAKLIPTVAVMPTLVTANMSWFAAGAQGKEAREQAIFSPIIPSQAIILKPAASATYSKPLCTFLHFYTQCDNFMLTSCSA